MSKRYIDANELIGQMHFIQFADGADRSLVYALIDMQPTSDVVEVVRCKDCTHCDCSIDGMGFFYCDFDEGRPVTPHGFCNVAERRKETL